MPNCIFNGIKIKLIETILKHSFFKLLQSMINTEWIILNEIEV